MQFMVVKFFLGGLGTLRTPLDAKGEFRALPPDPPATVGCTNMCMLAMLAFPNGDWWPHLQFSGSHPVKLLKNDQTDYQQQHLH